MFFLLGAKRSGTTFFRLLLNAHPDISIPKESHFLIPFLKNVDRYKKIYPEIRSEILDVVVNSGRFETWNITQTDVSTLLDKTADYSPLSSFIEDLFSLETGNSSALVGDKTPEYALFVPGIKKLFPESRIIFLLRDPRDTSDSLCNRGWEGWTAFQRGLYIRRVMRSALKHKNDSEMTLVRYEDLVTNTEQILKHVTHSLGTEYDANMLNFQSTVDTSITKREKESGVHTSLTQRPTTSHIEKWKNQQPSNYFFLEWLCSNEMFKLGYIPEFKRPTLSRFPPFFIIQVTLLWLSVIAYKIYHSVTPKTIKSRLRKNPVLEHVRACLRNL